MIVQMEKEGEGCPNVDLGSADDVAAKFLNDQFANMQAQSDSLGVLLLRVLEEAKQLEEFPLVFFSDADAVVNDLDFKSTMLGFFHGLNEFVVFFECQVLNALDVLHFDPDDTALSSELDGI